MPPEGEGPPPIEAILASTNGPKPYKVRAIARSYQDKLVSLQLMNEHNNSILN
jgi:hypothetical protein